MPDRGYPEPITDLECAQLPVRVVQPGAAQVAAADRIEDAKRELSAEQPIGVAANAIVADIVERAIVVDPGHPGTEMVARLVDSGEEQLRVVGAIGPEEDARATQLSRQVDQGRQDGFGHRIRLSSSRWARSRS